MPLDDSQTPCSASCNGDRAWTARLDDWRHGSTSWPGRIDRGHILAIDRVGDVTELDVAAAEPPRTSSLSFFELHFAIDRV